MHIFMSDDIIILHLIHLVIQLLYLLLSLQSFLLYLIRRFLQFIHFLLCEQCVSIDLLCEPHDLLSNFLLQNVWERLSQQYGFLAFLCLGYLHGAHHVESLPFIMQLLLPHFINSLHIRFIQLLILPLPLHHFTFILLLQLESFIANAVQF